MGVESLAISLPVCISLLGVVVAIFSYKLNKNKSDRDVTKDRLEEQKKHDEAEKQQELRQLNMEKDIQYIRLSVDGIVTTQKEHTEKLIDHDKELSSHEQRLVRLEKSSQRKIVKKEVK